MRYLFLSILLLLSFIVYPLLAQKKVSKHTITDNNSTIITSQENLDALLNKEIDFTITPANVLHHAYHGEASYRSNKHDNLRVIGALYPKMLAFITKADSNIRSIQDIKEKKLHIAFTCMETRTTSKTIFGIFDVEHNYPLLSFDQARQKLQNSEIDGFFSLCGHPSKNIKTLDDELNISILPLFGKKFDQLHNSYPYFIKGGIPKNMYKNIKKDIKSIGVKALLVTRDDVDEERVFELTQLLLDIMDEMVEEDFIYRGLSKKTLLEGFTIPQHEGAIKAFNAF